MFGGSPGTTLFRHEAVLYSGERQFVDSVGPLLTDGLRAGEPILVMVNRRKADLLQSHLGQLGSSVQFVDMEEVGRNPARIIPAWREFVDVRDAEAESMLGIGEPVWAERSAAELVECAHHETLLDTAFASGPSFRLHCPYDISTLEKGVIDRIGESHRHVVDESGRRLSSARYGGDGAAAATLVDPLPAPPSPAATFSFSIGDLRDLRAHIADAASEAGVPLDRVQELVLAADEIATNSIRYGGGSGTVRSWTDGGSLVVEMTDAGRIVDPMVGRTRPQGLSDGGYGLWLANQLCDLVQIRSGPDRTVVRLHVMIPSAA